MPAFRFKLRALAVLAMAMAASFASSASWAGGCSLASSGLAFGAYQPLTFAGKRVSTDRTSDATVSLSCTGIVAGGSYSISLGPSANGQSHPRQLLNAAGGPPMLFNVYLDPAYATVWGDGVTGVRLAGSIPGGDSTRSHTVYGVVPAGQNTVRVGSYSASLVMTVTYNP